MVEAAKNDGNIEAVLEFIKDKGIRQKIKQSIARAPNKTELFRRRLKDIRLKSMDFDAQKNHIIDAMKLQIVNEDSEEVGLETQESQQLVYENSQMQSIGVEHVMTLSDDMMFDSVEFE